MKTSTNKLLMILGSLNAGLAVLLGAFGAHALKARLSAEMLAVYQTGVQYHFYHALGLLILGLASAQASKSRWLNLSAGFMLSGIILFSGSLYVLALTGTRAWGMVTPFGGLAFILAWLVLAFGIWRTGAH